MEDKVRTVEEDRTREVKRAEEQTEKRWKERLDKVEHELQEAMKSKAAVEYGAPSGGSGNNGYDSYQKKNINP